MIVIVFNSKKIENRTRGIGGKGRKKEERRKEYATAAAVKEKAVYYY